MLKKINSTQNKNYNQIFRAKQVGIERGLGRVFQKYSSKDKLQLFEIQDTGFIQKIAKKLSLNPKDSIKIGLTGESGSGKSTFFDWIKERLSIKHDIEAGILRRDSYMHDYSEKVLEHGNYNNLSLTGEMEGVDCVDIERIIEDMDRLSKGYIVFPKKRIRETGVVIEQDYDNPIQPSRFLMTEGISMFHNKKLLKNLDLTIFAETSPEIIKSRWFGRAASRGKYGEVAQKCFELAKEKAEIFTLPYKKVSHLIYNTQSKQDLVNSFVDDLVEMLNRIK